MEWNYDWDACPLDTRVEILSENERNVFEGTITLSHDGKDKVKGEVFVGDGDYFYKLGFLAWRYCSNKIKELPKDKLSFERKPCTMVEYKTDGTPNRYYNERQIMAIMKPTELSDVIDKLNEVIRKINKEGE